jgi:hypothetical protein
MKRRGVRAGQPACVNSLLLVATLGFLLVEPVTAWSVEQQQLALALAPKVSGSLSLLVSTVGTDGTGRIPFV